MSTKCTLKHGDSSSGKHYHFYEECFDGENIYLDIDANFYAMNNGVTLEIPRDIWNEIVKVGELRIIPKEEMCNADVFAMLMSNGSSKKKSKKPDINKGMCKECVDRTDTLPCGNNTNECI